MPLSYIILIIICVHLYVFSVVLDGLLLAKSHLIINCLNARVGKALTIHKIHYTRNTTYYTKGMTICIG
jgi:hypothetical protein